MKKTLVILAISLYCYPVFGQYLFDISVGGSPQWAIAYPQENIKVNVRVKDLSSSGVLIYDNIYEFYYYQNKVIKEWLENGLDGKVVINGNSYISSDCYPPYIRTRNNHFQYGYSDNDSIILNRKGKASEVHSLFIPPAGFIGKPQESKITIKYASDTVVITYYWGNKKDTTPGFSVTFLDTLQNLKMIYWSEPDSAICDSVYTGKKSVFSLTNWEGTKFNYDKNRKRIKNIQHIYCTNGKEELIYTQYFIYQNGRPVRGYTIDEKTKKKIYQQLYTYKPYKGG